MSKEKRSAAKKQRAAAKRSARDQKRALYQQYAEEGRRKGGSKRERARRKNFLVANVKHSDGICPNTGCHACHPAEYNIPAGQRQLVARGLARWSPTLLKVVPA